MKARTDRSEDMGRGALGRLIYVNACPNCSGSISDARLALGLTCERCLPTPPEGSITLRDLVSLLESVGSLGKLAEEKRVLEELERFNEFFERALGSEPWSAQRAWAMRVLRGRSFCIVAPTGVGKTVFGLLMALYLSRRGRTYVVLPTTPLVVQAEEKVRAFAERLGIAPRIVAVHAHLKQKERKELTEKALAGDFDVLITTSRFMLKHCDALGRLGFVFVFVDDVDSVLKSGKSVMGLFKVLGLSEADLDEAWDTVRRLEQNAREIERLEEELEASKGLRGKKRRVKFEELWRSREELLNEEERLEDRLRRIREKVTATLVVSTATGRPRGPKVRLFRAILGFYPGSKPELIRNVVDSFTLAEGDEGALLGKVVEVVKRLGDGGLVYVPVDRGIEFAERVAEALRSAGVRAEVFHHRRKATLEGFLKGEIEVLVGVAVYYGVMVRGLDYPHRIRYAVFVGFPRHRFSARFEEAHPLSIYRMLSVIADVAPKEFVEEARRLLIPLRRILRRASPAMLQVLASRLREGAIESEAERLFAEAASFVRLALGNREVIESLKASNEIIIREENGSLYVYIPDLPTYIQASGRTSRLYVGGLTKGLSVTIVDDAKLFERAVFRFRLLFESVTWRDFDSMLTTGELEKVLAEVDEDRRRVIKALRGELVGKGVELIKTYLMIVESPNKARTISRFFGRPSIRSLGDTLKAYEVSLGNVYLIVVASGGHVFDLVTGDWWKLVERLEVDGRRVLHGVIVTDHEEFIPLYSSIKRCRVCGLQITDPEATSCPRCHSRHLMDKLEAIRALRELAMECDAILIATDPDTEGEKIGWDLALLLRPFTKEIRRVEFHEVTRKAILAALTGWRPFDERLVEAQLVRRIEDRWIGFTLSPLLWRDFWLKVYCPRHPRHRRECSGENRRLSAGRVQTPVLGWIIERFDESLRSQKTINVLHLSTGDRLVLIEIVEDELPSGLDVSELRGSVARVIEVRRERVELTPPPPYTTDSLIYDASRILRFGATFTMALAQDLFELGLITYHRTDSTRVSDAGIAIARDYLQVYDPGLFVPRTWEAEGRGAHEAIRPVRPVDAGTLRRMVETGEIELARPLTRAHYMLYDLIFRRFIASQSKKALALKQVVEVLLEGGPRVRKEQYIGYVEEGFAKYYQVVQTRQEIPPGDYEVAEVKSEVRRTVYPYTQGEVVNEMKRRGIGRPSTYAVIIDKLLSRKYVVSTGRLGLLRPTNLGKEVYEYLSKRFGNMVSEERTRDLEYRMDLVMEGKTSYLNVLKEVYNEVLAVAQTYGLLELEVRAVEG